MKKMIFSILTGAFIALPQAPKAGAGTVSRKAVTTCSALLATVVTGMAIKDLFAEERELPPGLGARVVASSDRRAIVELLAKALRFRSVRDDGSGGVEVVAAGDADILFEVQNLSYQDFENNTFVTAMVPEQTSGYLYMNNRLLLFDLTSGPDQATHLVIWNPQRTRRLLELRILQR